MSCHHLVLGISIVVADDQTLEMTIASESSGMEDLDAPVHTFF